MIVDREIDNDKIKSFYTAIVLFHQDNCAFCLFYTKEKYEHFYNKICYLAVRFQPDDD